MELASDCKNDSQIEFSNVKCFLIQLLLCRLNCYLKNEVSVMLEINKKGYNYGLSCGQSISADSESWPVFLSFHHSWAETTQHKRKWNHCIRQNSYAVVSFI